MTETSTPKAAALTFVALERVHMGACRLETQPSASALVQAIVLETLVRKANRDGAIESTHGLTLAKVAGAYMSTETVRKTIYVLNARGVTNIRLEGDLLIGTIVRFVYDAALPPPTPASPKQKVNRARRTQRAPDSDSPPRARHAPMKDADESPPECVPRTSPECVPRTSPECVPRTYSPYSSPSIVDYEGRLLGRDDGRLLGRDDGSRERTKTEYAESITSDDVLAAIGAYYAPGLAKGDRQALHLALSKADPDQLAKISPYELYRIPPAIHDDIPALVALRKARMATTDHWGRPVLKQANVPRS
ncbi:hypothetical protein [Polyangium jinanense]|uniref:Uncharacterized protein n=1 Tax=Polyangium jinanense TaxID=2829994 RepID=A0A9X3WX47_9BACT|nr:hypothetical protein [Polyangium jinanense]MDC3979799.1 hypothetical protein [Polyangium jinanense]